jgi:hypothetical protein
VEAFIRDAGSCGAVDSDSDAPEANAPEARPARVVLEPGSARVLVAGAWHRDVAVVPVPRGATAESVLATVPADAVLVSEGSPTAYVRVGDILLQDVPLFKTRFVGGVAAGSATEEVRVRVEKIRDRLAEQDADPETGFGTTERTANATAKGEAAGATEEKTSSRAAEPRRGRLFDRLRRKKE